jgi:hypothetical protein
MKRGLYIVAGVVIFAALAFVAGSLATNWYADHFAKSDSDINSSVGVFLLLWPLVAVLGGFVGNWVYRRNLTFR